MAGASHLPLLPLGWYTGHRPQWQHLSWGGRHRPVSVRGPVCRRGQAHGGTWSARDRNLPPAPVSTLLLWPLPTPLGTRSVSSGTTRQPCTPLHSVRGLGLSPVGVPYSMGGWFARETGGPHTVSVGYSTRTLYPQVSKGQEGEGGTTGHGVGGRPPPGLLPLHPQVSAQPSGRLWSSRLSCSCAMLSPILLRL